MFINILMMNLNLIPSEIPANSLNSETGQANSVTPIASEKHLSSSR